MKRSTLVPAAAGLALLALTLASCAAPADDGGGGGGNVVSGGTFVKAISDDPGDLDPMKAVSPDTFDVVTVAYESLIYVTPDGSYEPWLAASWTDEGTSATFTLKDGITCADGSAFTGKTVADNINYNADPANATFSYGTVITDAVSATAEGNVVTVTSTVNDPFLSINIGTIMMVCDAGLANVASLSNTTNGTGMFQLSEARPGDAYVFTKRDGYTWGPYGVTSDTAGLPDTIEERIVSDQSTVTNLLLSGEVNSGVVTGPDQDRLEGAGLKYAGVRNPVGQMLFNEREGRPFSDPLVREALSTAINRDEVGPVIAGATGLPSSGLVMKTPLLCVQDPPGWTLPATDLDRAGELLDQAGWVLGADGIRQKNGQPLTVKFIYDAPTASHAPAAELVKETWDKLGVVTELSANDAAAWSDQLYTSFDWDTGWVQIAPGSPVVLDLFFGGATPDKGGLNFMFVNNPEYNELATQAKTATPDAACGLWQQAEKKLIDRFDTFPVIDNILPNYMSGATFEQPNFLNPTSIRMQG